MLYPEIIAEEELATGVAFYHDCIDETPWHVYILEMDLTKRTNALKMVKAGQKLTGKQRTSQMVQKMSESGFTVLAAVNGDFFKKDGRPLNAQASDGVLLKQPISRSIFGITKDGKPFIEIMTFAGALLSDGGKRIAMEGINERRDRDELILYNRYHGKTTGTNRWGRERRVRPLNTEVYANDTVRAVVLETNDTRAAYNSPLEDNTWVVSGHGKAAIFLEEHVSEGDTIGLILELPPLKKPISEMIGGMPRLIRNGKISVEWQKEGPNRAFAYNRHPRTSVGFSKDSTRVYCFVVDGRQPGYSLGMSLFELAQYMLEWGVYQGLNLDGGGSSTMVVGDSVVNRPSDTEGERPVGNAVLILKKP